MAFRIDDYKCEECEHITEHMLNTRDENPPALECEECKSTKLVKVISVGAGKGGHISWSKWRV